jgi:glyoxylase-like metal-dependent hydrolase (beta-lactamase superfamily II)
VSWVDANARGYDPSNCYLVLESDAALLVDTGLHVHEQALLRQLAEILPEGMPLGIALTRVEPDCLGNLIAVAERFNVTRLASQSNVIPFDYLGPFSHRFPGVEIVNGLHPGDQVPVTGDRRLAVVEPAVRTLPTLWYWDEGSGTLFCSDFFGEDRPLQAHDSVGGQVSVRAARSHLLAKFDWIGIADTSAALVRLDRIFETLPVSVLAPGHGMWVVGRQSVLDRYRTVRAALTLQIAGAP